MPVAVVVGGQYGSEGKGKVAHWLAGQLGAQVAVRVGGSNSGHTVTPGDGPRRVLRQIPTASLLEGVTSVIAPGSYIEIEVLLAEIAALGLGPERLLIDPHAVVISQSAKDLEVAQKLGSTIGSTMSGTGGAVLERVMRGPHIKFARDESQVRPWVRPTVQWIREAISRQARVVIEGTQGFGLSLVHSDEYPFVTSRDTTAAAALSEAGLSPVDVDSVWMVIRAHPIRVAGNSGPLAKETTWEDLRVAGCHDHSLEERTSVTNRVRRVAEFDAGLVRAAVASNNPTNIILNHLDYLDHDACINGRPTTRIISFVKGIESAIARRIDYFGLSPSGLLDRTELGLAGVRRIV